MKYYLKFSIPFAVGALAIYSIKKPCPLGHMQEAFLFTNYKVSNRDVEYHV